MKKSRIEYIEALKKYTAALIVCGGGAHRASLVEAEERIGIGLYDANPKAEASRKQLVEAIRLNLIDRKRYPFEAVRRKYNLPVSPREFRRERITFCREVARLTGLSDGGE